MNIYEKMAKATEKIAKVAKGLTVETGKGKGYKAVGEADVLAAVKPIEAELGIYSYPVSREIVEQGLTTVKTQYGEGLRRLFSIATVYRFVNTENPDEYIDVTTYGDGIDSQDKAPGKAMTYADKYALLKAYKIQTGDDPDKDASDEITGIQSDAPATEAERKSFMDLCEKLGVDSVGLLQQVGWESGRMTKAHYGKAMAIIQKMTDK